MGGQWSARCPAHETDRHRSLSVRIGNKGQRIVWQCHRGCDPADVRRAMLGKGIDVGCVPWNPKRASGGVRPERERDVLAEVEEIIFTDAANPQRMRLRIGMALWGCDRHAAAKRLGISPRTAYRIKASSK